MALNQEVTQAIDQVRTDVDELISGIDLQGMARRVEDFGRASPMGLAVVSLALGVAVGLFFKRSKLDESGFYRI